MPAVGKGTSFLDARTAKLKTPVDIDLKHAKRLAQHNSMVEYNNDNFDSKTLDVDVPRRNPGGRHDANPSALKNLKYL
jgi:hypothetical protein